MSKARENFYAAGSAEQEKFPYILVAKKKGLGKQINIKDLTVRLPGAKGQTLVEHVNMTLKAGDRVMLTGASGTGKTTVAKALINLWDDGEGIIEMPEGMKVMAMSQQPHFPNTQLRTILNMTPEGEETFSDERLVRALQAVGHDRLVQHLPGQQAIILMNDLMPLIEQEIAKHGTDTDKLVEAVKPHIEKLAGEQFDIVQFVPEAQRHMFKTMLAKTMGRKGNPAGLGDKLLDELDYALAQPLLNHFSAKMSNIAQREAKKLIPLTPAKANYMAWNYKSALRNRISDYMGNKDTDDRQREIRINEKQADYIAEAIGHNFAEELVKNTKSGVLSQIFNTVTWPISALKLAMQGRRVAKESVTDMTFFMDRQIVTGNQFKVQLSGGEKQKLMIAAVLLHKPDILILDEITAALDKKSAQDLYSQMMKKLPKDTIVLSIAHNEHIRKYHTHEAHLANKTITVEEIDPVKPDAPKPAGPAP